MRSDLSRREFVKFLASLPLLKFASDISPTLSQFSSDQIPNVPNILIIVFDALSASNVSLYGYPRQTTPKISNFAESATVFHRHYAGGNFTTPGVASILTGVYPWSHRAFQPYGTVIRDFKNNNMFHSLSNETAQQMVFTHNDLASILLYQFGGYIDLHKKTAELCLFDEFFLADNLFSSDHNTAFQGERTITRGLLGNNLQLPSSIFFSGLHRVWRNQSGTAIQTDYADLYPRGLPSTNKVKRFFLLEDAIDWVKIQITNSLQPFLGYFHFLPPHNPYNTRKEFIGIFGNKWQPKSKPQHFFGQNIPNKKLNHKRRIYDEYIAYADAEFGRLIDYMKLNGLLKNTLLVLTSDHGEMFERGILHHSTETLYEPITRVPLIIYRPGQSERIDIYSPTSCTDLLPTLNHVLGKPVPDWTDGKHLPTFSDDEVDSERSIFTVEAKTNPKMSSLRTGTIAMVKDRYKLIHYLGYDGFEDEYEMYDLFNDPEEMDDLYNESLPLAKDLKAELIGKLEQVNETYI